MDDDQTFIGQVFLQFSDFFGDRRLLAIFSSVSSFQNFDVIYSDLSRRNQRSLHVFDNRDFYRGEDFNFVTGNFERGREAFKQTGVIASLSRPTRMVPRATHRCAWSSRTGAAGKWNRR